MEDNKISEGMAKLVRERGDKVSIHTEECVIWGLEHPNCVGCSSELGCGKVVKMLLVMMLPMIYESKNFEDFQKMQQRIEKLQEKILHARSIKELKGVPTA